jgi:hypothetical protein
MQKSWIISVALSLFANTMCWAAPFVVPAHSAYALPDPDAAKFRENSPIRNWQHEKNYIVWYPRFTKTGDLKCAVEMLLPAGQESKLRLKVGSKTSSMTFQGKGDVPVLVDFGSFPIEKIGYQAIELYSENPATAKPGDVGSLQLDGAAALDCQGNIKERRNAASVHLSYPQPKDVQVAGFYCEVTAEKDPVATYYMACGWHRGYFGMQVNSLTERRIIFSVWDSGGEAVSRDKVGTEDRVALIAKGEDVFTGDFGNEGTGGHSHLKYLWKTGEVQKFFMTANVIDENHTIFTGYWFHPEKKAWMLISSWRAPKEGKYLSGLYSFSENFGGGNGHLQRKAYFGNQWIYTSDKKWIEVTRATFSHDGTGKSDRLDRYMGVDQGRFFLSHGGFLNDFTKYGDPFDRPALNKPPVLDLPDHARK